MRNEFTNFKRYLQFLSPMDQLLHIDLLIEELTSNNNNFPGRNPKKKYDKIKELKNLRHNVMLEDIIESVCAQEKKIKNQY